MSEMLNVAELKNNIRKFAADRDWKQFHTPKNLVMALSGEAGELSEIFQWLTEKESFSIQDNPQKKEAVADEISDIIVYAIRLADVLNINIPEAIANKMQKNAKKYPVDLARGNSKKYNEL